MESTDEYKSRQISLSRYTQDRIRILVKIWRSLSLNAFHWWRFRWKFVQLLKVFIRYSGPFRPSFRALLAFVVELTSICDILFDKVRRGWILIVRGNCALILLVLIHRSRYFCTVVDLFTKYKWASLSVTVKHSRD